MNADKIRALFCECFPDTVNEADIILGFAREHGKIHETSIGERLASIACTCPIKDNGFYAEYIFACGTKAEFRGQGLFSRQLEKITDGTPALLIPENESLFAMYEHLGFKTVYCLKLHSESPLPLEEATLEDARLAHKSSFCFPKKSDELFEATAKAFLSYGNEIKRFGSAVLMMQGEIATEIFAQSKEEALSAALACKYSYLPLDMADMLDAKGLKYERIRIASAKNIPDKILDSLYINNLFN